MPATIQTPNYYTDTQLALQTLTANNAKLEDSIKLSEQAVKDLQSDYNRVTIEFERTQEEIAEARAVSMSDLPDPQKDEERVKASKRNRYWCACRAPPWTC